MSRRRRRRINSILCDKLGDDGKPCDGHCLAGNSRVRFTYYYCQKCGKSRKITRVQDE
jgi:hypothetical protein